MSYYSTIVSPAQNKDATRAEYRNLSCEINKMARLMISERIRIGQPIEPLKLDYHFLNDNLAEFLPTNSSQLKII